MLNNIIDHEIINAMKNRNSEKLEALRMIKSTLTKAAKDGLITNEASEIKVLQKMAKQTEDAIDQFKKANREDLVKKESADLEVIKQFLPKEVSDEEIMAATIMICNELQNSGRTINMSAMRDVMSAVQKEYPTASGKIISQVVRNWKKE